MTDEVTLQDRVLPIGDLKQKVLTTHATDLTDMILPDHNEPDLDDVPKNVRKQLHFHPMKTINKILTIALTENVAPWAAASSASPPRIQAVSGKWKIDHLAFQTRPRSFD
jgi:ATP-dependent Lon protease